jgi:ATP-dependent Clp protease ATP-binding subunit ClpA
LNFYNRIYGARPLKRAIQKYLENPLSMEILKGNIPDGAAVTADAEGETIGFRAN